MNKTVGIIGGLGKMGQIFKNIFLKQGYKVIVSDLQTTLSNKELAQKSDIVIISVPIKETIKIIKQVAPLIKKEALLMDLTSIKKEPLSAMLKYSSCSVLGAHPMFGPTNNIKGQMIIFCPGRGQTWSRKIQDIFNSCGLLIKKMPANHHDKIMAFVQGVNHFISFTFPHALSKSGIDFKEFLKFQTPAYRVVADFFGRYLHQDPHLYGSIQIENSYSGKAVEIFLNSGQEFLEIIQKKDFTSFINFFNQGKKYLGNFTQKAQQESDEIIDTLALKLSNQTFNKTKIIKNKTADLAVLGPSYTFSHLVAEKNFPQKTKILAATINEVFTLCQNETVKFALVPIENKIEGAVSITLDNLFKSELKIFALLTEKIIHNLIVFKKSKKSNIKKIFSHPQALAQCQNFIKNNFPQAALISTNSTSRAVEKISQSNNPSFAAIASSWAGNDEAKLKILFKNCGDCQDNETNFALITKEKFLQNKTFKNQFKNINCHKFVSLALVLKNKPGTLLKVLQDFAQAKINLTKIYSRPHKEKIGEFIFFLDFEGSFKDPLVSKTLQKVKKNCEKLKILGGNLLLNH